ncbi:FtsK/SpoIIIE domain-containing protein [Virgibacillus sp. FSP13]
MLAELGFSMIGGSLIIGMMPDLSKRKIKTNLMKAFENAELYKKKDKKEIFPKTLRIDANDKCVTIVFSVPKGINPEQFEKQLFVFKQHFGKHINLNVDEKRGVLKIYPTGLPTKFNYDYDNIKESIGEQKLPVVCGMNLEGNIYSFDLIKYPHILLSGETGSGKSSGIRGILTTLIKAKQPNELRLVLGDLKRSEFHLFKHIEHVEGVYHSADTLRPELKKVKREMVKRGNKLDEAGVNSIDELEGKIPYIIVCIDEVALLKKETDVMDILEEISSIGRSLGVFIMLSMQRPDSKLLDGKLKVNLTVRMGFMTADKSNAKIIGTPGAEKLSTSGRMILKVNSNLQEIQCPLLENKKAKKLLESYKKEALVKQDPINEADNEYAKVMELFKNE